MKRKWIASFLIGGLITTVGIVTAGEDGPEPGRDRNPGNDGLMASANNRVHDLLDGEVVLDTETEQTVWESEPFNTSRYNRIGLRFSVEPEAGPVTCRVCWRFTEEDEFLEGIPSVTLPRFAGRFLINIDGGDFGRMGPTDPVSDPELYRPDGVPDLYLQNPRAFYPLAPISVDFTEVRGLSGMVRCSLPFIDGPVEIGDDPSLRDDVVTIPSSATLTDVKVLLRRF